MVDQTNERQESGDSRSLRERYGPWAVIAGASDGIGEAFVRQLAGAGVNVVLIARRVAPLEALAADVRALGVTARPLSLDLTRADIVEHVHAATQDLDVGLLIYNAGSVSGPGTFVQNPVQDALALLDRNCRGPLLLAHYFGQRLFPRGRGGMLFMSAMAGLAGAAQIAVYAATKAFDILFAEGLWAELQPHGIDVLACLAGATLTPSLLNAGARFDAGNIPVMESAAVAAEALAQLPHGPTWIVGGGKPANRGAHLARATGRPGPRHERGYRRNVAGPNRLIYLESYWAVPPATRNALVIRRISRCSLMFFITYN